MLDLLDKFTALIQLISAVNFAYIATHFPNRVYRIIFDKKHLLEDKFSNNTNQIEADLQSLMAMQPITTTTGESNQEAIDSLKERYTDLHSRWETKREQIISEINTARNVKGSKCLFLSISLYCIISLFNIAILIVTRNEYWLMFTLFVNIGSLYHAVSLTRVMWTHKWDEKEDVHCYKTTLKNFSCILLAAIILGVSNWMVVCFWKGWSLIPGLVNIILSLCVLLPFYPCLISVLYIICNERKITKITGEQTDDLREEQQQLHSEYIGLNKAVKMFTMPKWSRSQPKRND